MSRASMSGLPRDGSAYDNAQTVLRYADQRDATADAEIRTWRRRRITGRPNS
ncbi:MAG: hypothetical protein ACRDRW_11570 [Pseudonocardiaceae bacterium]